jgi:tetratricopeptide (TPR) repeat protein
VPDLTDPATGGPLPGRETEWVVFTSYRVSIAQQDRDWPAAHALQQALIAWDREQAEDALTARPKKLDDRRRSDIRNLATDIERLGRMRLQQGQRGCVQHFLESIGLFKRIGDRHGEAIVAFNLGHAYKGIPELRDLDEAERWYKRAIGLLDESDTLGRARTTAQLGAVALQRFIEARNADTAPRQLARHLNDAVEAYVQALQLFPPHATGDLAVIHQEFGNVYQETGDIGRALSHYQKSIQYRERQDNRYDAGQVRHNAAVALMKAGRRHDALLYAHAALRDYQAVGPGGAAKADQERQLITYLEHGPPNEPSTNPV